MRLDGSALGLKRLYDLLHTRQVCSLQRGSRDSSIDVLADPRARATRVASVGASSASTRTTLWFAALCAPAQHPGPTWVRAARRLRGERAGATLSAIGAWSVLVRGALRRHGPGPRLTQLGKCWLVFPAEGVKFRRYKASRG